LAYKDLYPIILKLASPKADEEKTMNANESELEKIILQLDENLKLRTFLTGNHLSIADIAVAVILTS